MNKKHKILFSLCAVFVFAFSMFLVNMQPILAKADTLDSTYNVTFISPDNSILYSTGNNVPSGSTLQELENSNLMSNSALINNTTGLNLYSGNTNTVDNWYMGGGTYTVDTKTWFASDQWSGYVQLKDNFDLTYLAGKTVTLSAYISDINNSFRLLIRDTSNHTTSNFSTPGYYSFTYTLPQNLTEFRPGVMYAGSTGADNYITFDWFKLEIGSTATGYYNGEYISNKLSAYNFSNYYYQYDIDTSSSITSDKYFYPDKFSLQYDTWLSKVWSGLNNFNGNMVWSDGVNTYYSNGTQQYVLDVMSSTWVQKIWNGFSNLVGYNIWTDGSNYYYSNDTDQYVLDITSSTWSQMTWNGHSRFEGHSIWTDGINYYFSYNNEQFVLNQSTSTWSDKTWYGITNIFGSNVWTDGSNYYYSLSANQYVLDLSISTWTPKIWNGLNNFSGSNIWFNGINYCYSNGTQQYVLNVSTWKEQIWNGLNNFDGSNVWSNSFGIYYSNGTQQYVLASSLTPVDSSYYYQNGYNDGYNTGYNTGYNKGYNFGFDNAGNYTFFSLISAVMDAPLKVFYGLFNFDLMGVNLAGFIQALLSLAILIFVIRFALQK